MHVPFNYNCVLLLNAVQGREICRSHMWLSMMWLDPGGLAAAACPVTYIANSNNTGSD